MFQDMSRKSDSMLGPTGHATTFMIKSNAVGLEIVVS